MDSELVVVWAILGVLFIFLLISYAYLDRRIISIEPKSGELEKMRIGLFSYLPAFVVFIAIICVILMLVPSPSSSSRQSGNESAQSISSLHRHASALGGSRGGKCDRQTKVGVCQGKSRVSAVKMGNHNNGTAVPGVGSDGVDLSRGSGSLSKLLLSLFSAAICLIMFSYTRDFFRVFIELLKICPTGFWKVSLKNKLAIRRVVSSIVMLFLGIGSFVGAIFASCLDILLTIVLLILFVIGTVISLISIFFRGDKARES